MAVELRKETDSEKAMKSKMTPFVLVGFGSVIAVEEIVAITGSTSAPIVRSVQQHRADNKVIDLTHGKKVQAVIFLSSGRIVLSALVPETIAKRIEGYRGLSNDS